MKNESSRHFHHQEESASDTAAKKARSQGGRRQFLKASGAFVGAGAATAGSVLAQGTAPSGMPVPASMKSPGAAPGGDRLYGKPSTFEKKVLRKPYPGQSYTASQ